MKDKISHTTTGMQRATELIVDKKLMGDSVEGYPHIYKLEERFEDQPESSAVELQLLPYEEYRARLTAFVAYVEKTEKMPGGKINLIGTYRKNLTECPIF